MFVCPPRLDHRKFKQLLILLFPHWSLCTLNVVGALCMVLNKTEDLVSLLQSRASKRPEFLDGLSAYRSFPLSPRHRIPQWHRVRTRRDHKVFYRWVPDAQKHKVTFPKPWDEWRSQDKNRGPLKHQLWMKNITKPRDKMRKLPSPALGEQTAGDNIYLHLIPTE